MSTPHYSPVFQSGPFLFVSGQLPLINRDPLIVEEGIRAQARLVLRKTEEILKPFGLDRASIVKTTAYITDIRDWDIVNEEYASFFGNHKPARTVVPVPQLHFGCLIEVESVAALKI